MTNEFEDITRKLGRPKWYDDKGFPRYCKFHPDRYSNIYVDHVALIQIGCQRCKKKWIVAVGIRNHYARQVFLDGVMKWESKTTIEFPSHTSIGDFHYGDPPSHVKLDHGGSTMNSIPLRVIEFWSKNNSKIPRWKRVKKYERIIKVDWL